MAASFFTGFSTLLIFLVHCLFFAQAKIRRSQMAPPDSNALSHPFLDDIVTERKMKPSQRVCMRLLQM